LENLEDIRQIQKERENGDTKIPQMIEERILKKETDKRKRKTEKSR